MTEKETSLVLENARTDPGEGDLKYTPFILARKKHTHIWLLSSVGKSTISIHYWVR